MTEKLHFRRVAGELAEAEAEVRADEAELPAGEYLRARRIRLDDGTELRQHRVTPGAQRGVGYDRLDNEIIAGRLLFEAAGWSGYPREVTCLYGDEASSADPYTLFEPYRGEPLSEAIAYLLDDEREELEVSLLTGLCWLAAAGLAHRVLSPATVLWDSQRKRVQIADFSWSAVFGVPREAITGSSVWAARETRPGNVGGLVSERDDIWAAGRLIFFVRSGGEELTDRGQLAESGLSHLLDGVFGPPEGRPTARDLLVGRMRRPDPVPPGTDRGAALRKGRRTFWEARQRKHPGVNVPSEAAGDIASPPAPGTANSGPVATPPAPGPANPGPAAPPPVAGPAIPAPDPGADGSSRKPRDRGFFRRRGGG